MSAVDRLVDMHYARDGGRELFFPFMRLTHGFVVNDDQRRSINKILKPAYYVQLAALLAWWAFVTFDHMSMATAWAIPAGIVILYFSTAFMLAKIYVGEADVTAKAENRLFEARADGLVTDFRQTRFFRWSRIIALPVLGFVLFAHLQIANSWSEIDYGTILILVVCMIFLVVPPSRIAKWRRSRS